MVSSIITATTWRGFTGSTLARLRILVGCGLLGPMSATGCADPLGPRPESSAARLVISATVIGTPVATLVATVSAPDIPVSIVKNLIVEGGAASGTLAMPPGLARTITVTAFDEDGQVSHEGSRTIDVRRGPNPGITIPMIPRPGEVPITVQIGSVLIVLSQASAILHAGEALQMTATLTTADGEPITEEPTWATSAPAIVAVSSDGLVTALGPGTGYVVVTFAGVAAVAFIEVVADQEQP